MRRIVLSAFLILVPGFAQQTIVAQDADSLEKSVRHWVTLRKEWNEVKDEWKAQKDLLQDELQMLRRKKAELEQVLTQQKSKTEDLQTRFEESSKKNQTRRQALEKLKTPLLQSETHLRSWQDILPDFFLRHLARGLEKLPSNDAEQKEDDQAERLQLLFGLYGQLEHLNSVVHVERILLADGSGKEREMEVIFLGMSQGYALSLDGTAAAVGVMTYQGLRWTWRDDLAPSIREALACYRKEKPAEFTTLPLQIEKGGEQQ